MENVNIFCIMGKTGSGKNTYIDAVLDRKKFCIDNNVSLMVYGTTRAKRPGEEDKVDYHFHTKEEFNRFDYGTDLVEARTYYTMNDGEVVYFTRAQYFNTGSKNIICTVSPYQFESYKTWCNRENYKNKERNYNLFLILIETSLEVRLERLIKRASRDDDIYEACRRVVEERSEFTQASKTIPEIGNPLEFSNVCLIDNDIDNITENVEHILEFIKNKQ